MASTVTRTQVEDIRRRRGNMYNESSALIAVDAKHGKRNLTYKNLNLYEQNAIDVEDA